MSGECENCGEHTLECLCNKNEISYIISEIRVKILIMQADIEEILERIEKLEDK